MISFHHCSINCTDNSHHFNALWVRKILQSYSWKGFFFRYLDMWCDAMQWFLLSTLTVVLVKGWAVLETNVPWEQLRHYINQWKTAFFAGMPQISHALSSSATLIPFPLVCCFTSCSICYCATSPSPTAPPPACYISHTEAARAACGTHITDWPPQYRLWQCKRLVTYKF